MLPLPLRLLSAMMGMKTMRDSRGVEVESPLMENATGLTVIQAVRPFELAFSA